MDKVISQKRKLVKRLPVIIILAAAAVFTVTAYVIFAGKPAVSTSKEGLRTAKLEKGLFREYYPLSGLVILDEVHDVYTFESGLIKDRFVKTGAPVVAGTPLFQLENPDLEKSAKALERQIQDAQLGILQTDNDHNVELALLEQEMAGTRYNIDQINPYSQTQQNKDRKYWNEVLAIQTKRAGFLESKYLLGKKQLENNLYRLIADLDEIRIRREKTLIRSVYPGIVTETFVNEGQLCGEGTLLARIGNVNQYKIAATVPDLYMDKVVVGTKALVVMKDKDNGTREFPLVVSSCSSEIKNRQFTIELFIPEGGALKVIRGQTLEIQLLLSDEKEALLLAKGPFFQTTGGRWVFVVNREKNMAYKRPIEPGRSNPQFLEIASGLESGEEVIISGYEEFKDSETISLE